MKRNEDYITWENALFTARQLFCKGSAVDLSALREYMGNHKEET